MSQNTRFLCYYFGLKYSSVLFFTLIPSLFQNHHRTITKKICENWVFTLKIEQRGRGALAVGSRLELRAEQRVAVRDGGAARGGACGAPPPSGSASSWPSRFRARGRRRRKPIPDSTRKMVCASVTRTKGTRTYESCTRTASRRARGASPDNILNEH